MDFRTIIDIPVSDFKIDHESQISMFGSCFIENIGSEMIAARFCADINPFGVLYNPLSISQAIKILLDEKEFEKKDIFEHQGLYHSFYYHSRFSDSDAGIFLDNINKARATSSLHLTKADILLITFGTAFAYTHKEQNIIVGNCHKLPQTVFDRKRIGVESIVEEWDNIIYRLKEVNPDVQIIFTVSPIRHMKDGAHENQLSKATLLLAINELTEKHGNTSYFPSYEIVLDELRDYRFYADDMVHPSLIAVKYIWDRFSETYFTEKTKQIINEWKKIQLAINHRPFNAETSEHKLFLKQTLLKLEAFRNKYPYIYCEKEISDLKNKIQN